MNVGESINYPATGGDYPSDANCEWNITGSPPFRLHFQRFDLEPDSSCSYDWVQVDGGSQMCGRSIPQDIQISKSSVALKFHSDGSDQYKGFKIDVLAGKHFFLT